MQPVHGLVVIPWPFSCIRRLVLGVEVGVWGYGRGRRRGEGEGKRTRGVGGEKLFGSSKVDSTVVITHM